MDDASMIVLINRLSFQLNRYITLFVFLFGTVGNLLNILVLAQARLRANPSVVYFLGSSVAGLGIILVGLPSRIVAGWVSSDPTMTNSLLCRFRIFFLYGFRTTSVWLIVFASVDRWLSSSAHLARRRLSTRSIAYRVILVTHLCSFLLWAESLYCYETDVPLAPLGCYGKTKFCRIFNDIVYASSAVAIPSLFMLIFGLLTIRNINRSRRAVEPTGVAVVATTQRRLMRRNQSSLARMLIFQVIVLTLFSLPQAMHQFYLTFTIQMVKSPLRVAVESFVVNLDFSLTYVGNGIPFYIYTLTGTVFRQALFRLVRQVCSSCARLCSLTR